MGSGDWCPYKRREMWARYIERKDGHEKTKAEIRLRLP